MLAVSFFLVATAADIKCDVGSQPRDGRRDVNRTLRYCVDGQGRPNGTWLVVDDKGIVRERTAYAAGVENGVRVRYRPDGSPLIETRVERGVPHGRWSAFHTDGSLRETGAMVAGKRQGSWSTFDTQRRLSSVGAYLDDVPVGEWTFFEEDGRIRLRCVAGQTSAPAPTQCPAFAQPDSSGLPTDPAGMRWPIFNFPFREISERRTA